ncbi:MAG: hypothetical protein ACLS95_05505 [Clostridia bacterium]
MKNLIDIIKNFKITKISNEKLYQMSDLEKALNLSNEDEFDIDELVIIPFYIEEGKLYELYAFELNIRVVKERNFDKYMLKFTGQEKMEDIPLWIIERQKKCYIEIKEDERTISKTRIQEYLNYINNSEEIKEDITSVYGNFTKDNLYFELY